MAVRLDTLRTRIRQRTDNENSSFVSDSELNQLINTEYKELYGQLVRYSLQRSETLEVVTADGSSDYALPLDFYSLIAVFRVDSTTRIQLPRHSERFRPGTVLGMAQSYRLIGGAIEFYPTPTTGNYELLYIPVPAELSLDEDTLDGVLGWEEMVVLAVSIKVLDKEEANADHLRRDKAEIMRRIQDEAAAVEFTENWVVQDVRRSRSRYADLLEGTYTDRTGIRRWPW
jgi:hypothetical protein